MYFLALFFALLASVAAVFGVTSWLAVRRAGRIAKQGVRAARRFPVVRNVPLIGVKPAVAPANDADLLAYPERLRALEEGLTERHRAVQEQLRVLGERRAELGNKADRADLVERYESDIGHLDRRASSMRRVMGLVWRTRAILVLRVHLAITGRRRPELKGLPALGGPHKLGRVALEAARTAYGDAASSVRFYVDEIQARGEELAGVLPAPPPSADVEEAARAAVAAELAATEKAHGELSARMDRLADNLVWLSDHAGTLAVAEDHVAAPLAGPHGESAAHLLEEVNTAVARLNELAGAVDHQLAGRALDDLTADVGQLEQAGLEEEAAAKAELEVSRLMEGFAK